MQTTQQAKPYLSVIIVSNALTDRLQQITQMAINTALTGGVDIECIIVEKQPVAYMNATTIPQPKDFNYNACLNEGVKFAQGEYYAFCNNDLLFQKNWAAILLERMKIQKVRSASPACPAAHLMEYNMCDEMDTLGTHTRKYLAGWCYVWHNSLYKEFGKLPENYEFYCADNIITKMLNEKQELHLLTTRCYVTHIGNSTSIMLDDETKEKYTNGCVRKYNKEQGDNIFGLI